MHVPGKHSTSENIKNKANIISSFNDIKKVVLETLHCNSNISNRERESGSTSDTHYNQILGLNSKKFNPLAKPFIPRTYLTRKDTENSKILDSNALSSLLNTTPVAHEISTPGLSEVDPEDNIQFNTGLTMLLYFKLFYFVISCLFFYTVASVVTQLDLVMTTVTLMTITCT